MRKLDQLLISDLSLFLVRRYLKYNPYILHPKFRASSHFYDRTTRFVSDMVGNAEDRFSRDVAHMILDA